MLALSVAWLTISQTGWCESFSNDDLAFFEQKVRPLLIEKCFECHSQRSDKIGGGLRLDARDTILSGGDNGPAVIAGQPGQSLLVRAIHYSEPKIEMPPDGKLNDRSVAVFEDWIRRGLPYANSAGSQPEKKKVDIESGRKHWSFQPLRKDALPEITNRDWPNRSVDTYIASQLEKHGIDPVPAASRRALLRRAKFDLIGLPPTPDEYESFVHDKSMDAFDQRVQQWLASPSYGERWARPWLELVRYCDIPEPWAETQGNCYLYRDWVVQSLNDDMPFDRFSMLQIAADQMDDARPSDIAALGFLGLSPTYWKELQLPVEIIKSIVSDEYEERVHTLSSTFLGINMACARCHDHKFDPITVEDYYALAGVFASTRLADRSLIPGVDALKVFDAHQTVKKLEENAKKISADIKKMSTKTGDQKLTDDETKKIEAKKTELDKTQEQIALAKQIAGFDQPLAPGVFDATLEVKDAIGSHGSRIVYSGDPIHSPIEIRGDPNKPGATIPRRFVAVLSTESPKQFQKGSGRVELAQSLFRESQALVARVIVNRIWKLHFGTGIVDTPSDFGNQGAAPTHPELLDHLATRFIERSWSLKWLHREIMLSATYQQASAAYRTNEQDLSDSGLRHYSGFPIRRLEVEAWRDAMLMATDALDLSQGGKPTELAAANNFRRTLYGTVKRRELSDFLRLYDFPDPITHSPNRIATNTPLQQLFTLNSPFIQDQAKRFVDRLDRDAGAEPISRIRLAHAILYGRPPTDREWKLGLEFVRMERKEDWQQYAQVLIGSNEFLYLD
ncbi:MAG: DUF1553 domain-containing protein [Pirellula sp.]